MYGVVIIMKNPLYITSHGILSRKNNTLYFIKEDVKKLDSFSEQAIMLVNNHIETE